jgi:hypothetical protein
MLRLRAHYATIQDLIPGTSTDSVTFGITAGSKACRNDQRVQYGSMRNDSSVISYANQSAILSYFNALDLSSPTKEFLFSVSGGTLQTACGKILIHPSRPDTIRNTAILCGNERDANINLSGVDTTGGK